MLSPPDLRSLHCGVLVILAALASLVHAADTGGGDAQVIAERICSFPHFVEWPARKFAQPDAPFVIGVYGADAITGVLREIMQDRRVKDHPVVIKQVLAMEEFPGCHIVYVSRSENAQLGRVLGAMRRAGVLTIGQSDNFLSRGGVVNLLNVDGTIRFQISLDSARREHLNVSSKLLQLSLSPNGAVTASVP